LKYLYAVFIFLAYAMISCSGLYLLKAAPSWYSVKFVIGGVLYVTGAAVWLVILRLFPLSVAFPIASGMLIIGTTLTGFMFLGEKISLVQFFGVALILVGITFVGAKVGNV